MHADTDAYDICWEYFSVPRLRSLSDHLPALGSCLFHRAWLSRVQADL